MYKCLLLPPVETWSYLDLTFFSLQVINAYTWARLSKIVMDSFLFDIVSVTSSDNWPREPFPIPHTDRLLEVRGRQSRKMCSCYYPAPNLTFLKGLPCTAILEHQSLWSPDQDVLLLVNCRFVHNIGTFGYLLVWNILWRFCVVLLLILFDVFRFSPPFGGVTLSKFVFITFQQI